MTADAIKANSVHHSDIFDLCAQLPDASVDMILCDLPYGVTACEWDVRIPVEPMWQAFKRVIKPRGAIVLTATNPFAAELIMSNLEWFKYEWVWDKKHAGNFLTVHIKPLMVTEYALVFSSQSVSYYPQLRRGRMRTKGGGGLCRVNGLFPQKTVNNLYHPTNILVFSNAAKSGLHPTQKPVALFEYLIRTYTQPGEVVFDPCVGSGTTAIAARKCGRQFIVGDMLEEYVEITRERLAEPYTIDMFDQPEPEAAPTQQELL